MLVIAVPIIVLLLVLAAIEWAREKREDAAAAAAADKNPPFDPHAGGHPVPPLPGQDYRPQRRTKTTVVAGVEKESSDG